MVAAAVAGISPHEALDYTQRMIGWALDAYTARERSALKMALFEAYHVEGFARTKRLPNLAQLLRKLDPVTVMSARAQNRAIVDMAKAMGAEVIYRKKGERR